MVQIGKHRQIFHAGHSIDRRAVARPGNRLPSAYRCFVIRTAPPDDFARHEGYSFFTYSIMVRVSFESTTIFPSLSTVFPPKDHRRG